MGKSTPRVRLKRKRRKRYLTRKAARTRARIPAQVVDADPVDATATMAIAALRAFVDARGLPTVKGERRSKAGLRKAIARWKAYTSSGAGVTA